MSAPVEVWVGYPRSYTAGRARAAQYVTLHYTAGSEGPSSAENGASYDKTRTDGTSCHAFVDSQGLPCREVPDGDRSHSALWHGNEIGIQIELCGTKQSRSQWLDPVSMATLQYAADLVADICQRHGFPIKRLSVSETRAAYYASSGKRPKGINDHYTVTQAYPEDGGDHTDVGSDFPWDVFLDLVKEADDVALTPQEHWRLLNTSAITADLARGEDSTTVYSDAGESSTLSLLPFWARIADDVATKLAGGITVPAIVDLTPASVDAIAQGVNDDAAARLAE